MNRLPHWGMWGRAGGGVGTWSLVVVSGPETAGKTE